MSFLDLRLKEVTQQTTYTFSFYGCDSVFEWTSGDTNVLEIGIPTSRGSRSVIPLDCVCKTDNLKSVIRYVKRAKEEEVE